MTTTKNDPVAKLAALLATLEPSEKSALITSMQRHYEHVLDEIPRPQKITTPEDMKEFLADTQEDLHATLLSMPGLPAWDDPDPRPSPPGTMAAYLAIGTMRTWLLEARRDFGSYLLDLLRAEGRRIRRKRPDPAAAIST